MHSVNNEFYSLSNVENSDFYDYYNSSMSQFIPEDEDESHFGNEGEMYDNVFFARQYYNHPESVVGFFDYNGKIWLKSSHALSLISVEEPSLTFSDLEHLLIEVDVPIRYGYMPSHVYEAHEFISAIGLQGIIKEILIKEHLSEIEIFEYQRMVDFIDDIESPAFRKIYGILDERYQDQDRDERLIDEIPF
jgi:hypothetical protein